MARRRQAWLLAALTVAGCSVARSDTAADAAVKMIGLTRDQLYRCAGVPNRTASFDGTDYATFDNSEFVSSGLTLPLIGGGLNTVESQYCRTTVTLVGDRVTSVTYSGDTGAFYARNEQCAYTVRRCLADAEHLQTPAPVQK